MSGGRIKNCQVHRPIVYGNTARLLTDAERLSPTLDPSHTHRWTLAVRSAAPLSPEQDESPPSVPGSSEEGVRGGEDHLLPSFIKKVSFKLHETYPNHTRTIDRPPFIVSETGWGEFDVVIKIFFTPESGEKPVTVTQHLKLHPWNPAVHPPHLLPPPHGHLLPTQPLAKPDAPVHSWTYDELVFSDPYETFYATLLSAPFAPLPEKAECESDTCPVWTAALEREEADRLSGARKLIVGQIEKYRDILIRAEKELDAVRADAVRAAG